MIKGKIEIDILLQGGIWNCWICQNGAMIGVGSSAISQCLALEQALSDLRRFRYLRKKSTPMVDLLPKL